MTWGAVAVAVEGEDPSFAGTSTIGAPSRVAPAVVAGGAAGGGAAAGGGIGAPAIIGGLSVVGGFLGQQSAAEAQAEANRANERIARLGVEEQSRQFNLRTGELSGSRREREDEINRAIQGRFETRRGGLDPFIRGGQEAFAQRQALLGLGGEEARTAALSRFTESPGQVFLRERQERALLRNASALGGLGGGNVRAALQEQAFGRAQTDLDRQLARLTGVTREGLTATQAGLREPGRLSTGVDVGVQDPARLQADRERAAAAEAARRAADPKIIRAARGDIPRVQPRIIRAAQQA